MTSPTDTRSEVSPTDINFSPFTNAQPFSDAWAGRSDQDRRVSEQPSDKDTANKNGDGSSSNDETEEYEDVKSREDKDSDSNDILKTETKDDQTLGEKIKHVYSDGAHAFAEKIKSKTSDKLHLHNIRVTGPTSIFNPTTVRAKINRHRSHEHDEDGQSSSDSSSDLNLLWRARDNRKGRISLFMTKTPDKLTFKRKFNKYVVQVVKNCLRLFILFPYWDMAFWSGWSYTIGSALFVIDGAMAWSKHAYPSSEFDGEAKWAIPWIFLIGALFYQLGAVMAYLEAVNDGSFHGSAMRRLLDGHDDDQKRMLDEKIHNFFGHMRPHRPHFGSGKDEEDPSQPNLECGWNSRFDKQRHNSLSLADKALATRRGAVDLGETDESEASTYVKWRWWPSWYMLRTHHIYEIGFVACAIQLFGVTLYGVTAVVAWPEILDSLNAWQTNAAYWIPQIVAAACFLIASLLFMFETQEKWWKPEPKVLGWWVGFWATVGSVGFELSAAFGPAEDSVHWAEYQSSLSSTWGSAAYLVCSYIQWYEAIYKNPVGETFNEPGAMKSYQVHGI